MNVTKCFLGFLPQLHSLSCTEILVAILLEKLLLFSPGLGTVEQISTTRLFPWLCLTQCFPSLAAQPETV